MTEEQTPVYLLGTPEPDPPTLPQSYLLGDAPARPPARTLGEVTQGILDTAALPLGGFGGGALGGLLGGPPGLVGGAMLGGIAGGQIPEITRPFLTPTAPPVDFVQRQLEITRDAALGGMSEGAGQAIGRAVQGMRPFGSRLAPGALEAQRALQRQGARLTPAQVSQSRAVDYLENIAEGSLLGGGRLTELRQAQPQAVAALTDDIVTRLESQAPSKISQLLTDEVGAARNIARSVQKQMYNDVDAMARGVTVDATALVKRVQDNPFLARIMEMVDSQWASKLSKTPETGGGLGLTFKDAHDFRSQLRVFERMKEKAISPDVEALGRNAGFLAQQLDSAMGTAANRLDPAIKSALDRADTFVAKHHQAFNNELLRSVVKRLKKEPGRLTNALLGPNSVDRLKVVERAATNEWPEIQNRLAQTMIQRASPKGELNGAALLQGLNGLGEETARVAFKPEVLKELLTLGRTADLIAQNPTRSVGGKMLIQLTQGGAIVTLITAPFTGASTATLGAATGLTLGPYVLSRVLTNPATVRAMTEGIQARALPDMLRVAGRLAATHATTGRRLAPDEEQP